MPCFYDGALQRKVSKQQPLPKGLLSLLKRSRK